MLEPEKAQLEAGRGRPSLCADPACKRILTPSALFNVTLTFEWGGVFELLKRTPHTHPVTGVFAPRCQGEAGAALGVER